MKYYLELSFCGKNYRGWQFQHRAVSVQETVEETLSTILEKQVSVVGCGRTDSGVHARQFFLHFNFETELPANFLSRVNKFLPKDIVIKRYIQVDHGAHARYDATLRTYEYLVHFSKDPFLQEWSFFYPYGIPDIELMNEAAGKLTFFRDFAPLSKNNPDLKTTLCQVYNASWEKTENGIKFEISANRFLHSMVRRIVGCLLLIGLGKLSLQEFESVMRTKGTFSKVIAVPSQGLYLASVEYPYL